ncbi:creatininase family protein [Herbiconiux sp. A18JL235]|uniref:Creatininase family protein n=1 Tax=Herbiconiux sp. A18JL235 TaxID=3152363 RepID=A0AB39BCP9_9MICO
MSPHPARASRPLRSPEVSGVAARGGVALQPVGATEQHGPHLPVTTDSLIAEALATRAAALLPDDLPAWLLPTLAYGLSPEHAGRPGTVSLSTTTLLALCLDLGRAVAASGLGTLIFVNAHGGNPDLLRVACRDIRADSGVRAHVVHAPALPLPDELVERMREPAFDIHAGFYETSVMLALHPETVDLAAAQPDGLAVRSALRGLEQVSLFGGVSLPWFTDDLSVSGTIGDPTGADASWGEAALAAHSTALARAVEELARFEYPPLRGAPA